MGLALKSDQVRHSIIRPVLLEMAEATPCKYTDAAENLLMGTWAHESAGGSYIKQVGGPACGIFQIEPVTAQSVIDNYIAFRPAFKAMLDYYMNAQPLAEQITTNLALQVFIARLVYYPKPEALPSATDLRALAGYWKRHYNSKLGKGTVQKFMDDYTRYVL